MIVSLNSRIISLAPMAGYTDFPYRSIVREVHLEMATTEMISVKALLYGNDDSWKAAIETGEENETGIQLFGSDPGDFRDVIQMIESRIRPAFFELNAGCPVKKVVKKGAGAYLLKDLKKLRDILVAMREATLLPVALKTRLGWDSDTIVIEDVVRIAMDSGVNWITIHGRTRAQMYGGRANLRLIGMLAEKFDLPIIANGDIRNREQIDELFTRYPLAGIAIGRGAIGNPWIFGELRGHPPPTLDEKKKLIFEHIDRSVDYYGEVGGVLKLIPHLVKYVRNVPNAKEYRERIVKERDPGGLKLIIGEAFHVEDTARSL